MAEKTAIVVGGGVAGCFASLALLALGMRVTVWNCPSLGLSGSRGAYGVLTLRNRPVASPLRFLLRRGYEAWPDLYSSLGLGSLPLQSFVEVVTPELREGHEVLRDPYPRKIPLEDVQRWVGEGIQLRPSFVDALWVDGYVIDPSVVLASLRRRSCALGAVWRENPVPLILRVSKGRQEAELGLGEDRLRADWIVWATGAWAHQQLPAQIFPGRGYRMETVGYDLYPQAILPASFPNLLSHDGYLGRLACGIFCVGAAGKAWPLGEGFQKNLGPAQAVLAFRSRVSKGYPVIGRDPCIKNLLWVYGLHRVGWTLGPVLPTLLKSQIENKALTETWEAALRCVSPQRVR